MKYEVIIKHDDGRAPVHLRYNSGDEARLAVDTIFRLDAQGLVPKFLTAEARPVIECGGRAVCPSLVDLIRKLKTDKFQDRDGVMRTAVGPIPLIKVLREVYVVGLKEAKDCYDSI